MAFSLSPRPRALAAGVVAAAALAGAFALGAGQDRAAAAAPAAPGARITVTGTGTVSGAPDQLQLSMGVQTNGAAVGGALSRANQAVRAVTTALEADGVAAADIQTSGLSIQPDYRGGSSQPDGYGVNESITVTLRRLGKAGSQISRAVRAGGNATVVDGVSLNLSDTGPLLASARAKAVADAKAKASAYARALGRTLGPVVSMSERTAPSAEPMLFGSAAGASARPVPVSPGSQQLSVTVTVVFSLT